MEKLFDLTPCEGCSLPSGHCMCSDLDIKKPTVEVCNECHEPHEDCICDIEMEAYPQLDDVLDPEFIVPLDEMLCDCGALPGEECVCFYSEDDEDDDV